ncbi:hypothetical protein, partial [Staphylococcus pseudintermedius]
MTVTPPADATPGTEKIPNKGISLSMQRKLWLRYFLQAFFV